MSHTPACPRPVLDMPGSDQDMKLLAAPGEIQLLLRHHHSKLFMESDLLGGMGVLLGPKSPALTLGPRFFRLGPCWSVSICTHSEFSFNSYAAGGYFGQYKMMQKTFKKSSESTQRELSNEYQNDRIYMFFKNPCILVLWTKVASALEGLTCTHLEFSWKRIIWIYHIFMNNIWIKPQLAKYL